MALFQLIAHDFQWICGPEDDPDDLCLHGTYTAIIGEERFSDECTVSAAALYLLKSLNEDHAFGQDSQMFPCCGRELYADEDLQNVTIAGCPNGIDLQITHVPEGVQIVTERGNQVTVPLDVYRAEVFRFADQVKAYYDACVPKNPPEEEWLRRGYTAFWNEWERRRNG